jgi:hypothetical protein
MSSPRRPAIAGPALAVIGATVFVGCAASVDDTASTPTRGSTAENKAALALAGVTVDVRRDPG